MDLHLNFCCFILVFFLAYAVFKIGFSNRMLDYFLFKMLTVRHNNFKISITIFTYCFNKHLYFQQGYKLLKLNIEIQCFKLLEEPRFWEFYTISDLFHDLIESIEETKIFAQLW
ncbi:uncharacterized protein LOC136095420 isoform X1 [Hydra vulgaris]|uniref:uncharacterized protein LOC136095420 isoform X1 n=2 Tax=Hydra vulgaris TaxID=6087 RepID=UPI0032EA87E4